MNFSADGHLVAGMAPAQPGVPDSWTTYLCVDDAAATVTAAEAAGASVQMPAMAVGELGSMAVLTDPAGAVFGIWQPGSHTGFGRYNEPGAVAWDEVHSKDFAATASFYPEVFGWGITKTSDTEDFRYYVGEVGGESVAGMMDSHSFLSPEVPSHWEVYFSTSDADATIAAAVTLGATVRKAAEDTPFGRIVELADPTGAAFNLHQELPQT